MWFMGFLVLHAVLIDAYLLHQYFLQKNVLGETTEGSCPQACIARINQVSSGSSASTAAKEFFVPLGSGASNSTDWVDVAGAASYIDTTSYTRMKTVTFEATTAIPAGGHRIWVRLYNVTDKHPVWFSEMTTDASTATLLTSKPLTLDRGNKLYQVQMKVQLQNLTNLVQSRVKITTY